VSEHTAIGGWVKNFSEALSMDRADGALLQGKVSLVGGAPCTMLSKFITVEDLWKSPIAGKRLRDIVVSNYCPTRLMLHWALILYLDNA
jgi:hypothetical protein